jgi:hypothetical protein
LAFLADPAADLTRSIMFRTNAAVGRPQLPITEQRNREGCEQQPAPAEQLKAARSKRSTRSTVEVRHGQQSAEPQCEPPKQHTLQHRKTALARSHKPTKA